MGEFFNLKILEDLPDLLDEQIVGARDMNDALKACNGKKAVLAERIGVSRQQVENWFIRGSVSKWWRAVVLEMARSHRQDTRKLSPRV